jgi:hypothetical protein
MQNRHRFQTILHYLDLPNWAAMRSALLRIPGVVKEVLELAHHTVSGCNMQVGDLMGSGTISGSASDSFGSLLELTWNGQKPLALNAGLRRAFLWDGDKIIMRGWRQGEGYRIGFGTVRGKTCSMASNIAVLTQSSSYEFIRPGSAQAANGMRGFPPAASNGNLGGFTLNESTDNLDDFVSLRFIDILAFNHRTFKREAAGPT